MANLLRVDNDLLKEDLRKTIALEGSLKSLLGERDKEINLLKEQLASYSTKAKLLKDWQRDDPFSGNVRTINTLRNEITLMEDDKQAMLYSYTQKENEYKRQINELRQEVNRYKEDTKESYKREVKLEHMEKVIKEKTKEIEHLKEKYNRKLKKVYKEKEDMNAQLHELKANYELTQKVNEELKSKTRSSIKDKVLFIIDE